MATTKPTVKLYFLVLLLFVTNSLAIPHPIQKSGNHTKCAYSQLPTGYLSIGKTISVPGDCMEITCQPDLTITGLTCPTYYEFPGCRVTEINYYTVYPDCCPQIICDQDENLIND